AFSREKRAVEGRLARLCRARGGRAGPPCERCLMEFEVITLFPAMFGSVLEGSLLGRAREAGLLTVHFTNPRDLAAGKHRSVDDTPYGGGAGMVMRPGPLVDAIEAVERTRGAAHKVLLSPVGRR